MNQKLHFNILTLDWPDQPITFYFSLYSKPRTVKIHRSIFPKNIYKIFPQLRSNNADSIYSSFDKFHPDSTPLDIDLKLENPNFIKRFYNKKIYDYFTYELKQVVKRVFTNDNQIWLSTQKGTTYFDIYEKYTLKIKVQTVSQFPEVQISYDGESKILKTNVPDLLKRVPPKFINLVFYKNKIRKYKTLEEEENTDYDICFPVLSKPLAEKLGFQANTPNQNNRFLRYLENIERFKNTFLSSESFQKMFNLSSIDFLSVSPEITKNLDYESSFLEFKGNNSNVPKDGMKILKPYEGTKGAIHLFFILHNTKEQRDIATKLMNYFEEGLSWYRGLYKYANIRFHTEKGFSISYNDIDNPIPEVEKTLSERTFLEGVRYIAIIINPFEKSEDNDARNQVHYRLKEILLNRNCTSQTIKSSTITVADDKFAISLPNISVALLAKLNGIPWRLKKPIENELIVGVGAFKHLSTNVQYLGSSFSFDNSGRFNRFEYFTKSDTDLLAGSIMSSIRDFKNENKKISRLVIHFYKTMSEKELQPIQEGLDNLGLDIPVFIVSIIKTEADDIFVYDDAYKQLMPLSGTHIKIGENKYLLFNNARYKTGMTPAEKYHFPIKLTIKSVPAEALREVETKQLIDQVYQFSRMYWRSIKQQNLPVTVKYPEMVAKIAPYFQDEFSELALDNLWFL